MIGNALGLVLKDKERKPLEEKPEKTLKSLPPPKPEGPYHPAELKSGLQKYIRRGMTESAIATAMELYVISPAILARRIVVIAVEDVGWDTILMTHEMSQEILKKKVPEEAAQSVAQLVTLLCSLEKDKDCYAMAALVCDSTVVPTESWQKSLEDGVKTRDEMMVCMAAKQAHQAKEAEEFVKMLAILMPVQCRPRTNAHAALTRSAVVKDNMFEWVMFVAAATYTLCRTDAREMVLPATPLVIPSFDKLDWYAMDMHTWIGKIALEVAEKKSGWPKKRIEFMWWWFASAKVDRLRPDQR